LETWKEILFETATMMADFVAWEEKSGRYILGPPVMSGAEGNSGFESWNSTSELNYWAMSLEIAQKWRQRLGITRDPQWDHILAHLSRPPIAEGVYIDAESHPSVWNQSTPGHFLRPAWFEVYGCIRGSMIDPATMNRTYERAATELRTGQWKGNLWGCDYPMMAMTAARLGKSKEAIDWLLYPTSLNYYTPNGFCAGWYLPGNGGLLYAVAMMAAGWDGSPEQNAPGFPKDGKWVVRWEGLKKAP
jgi:protein-glucosylgalactosylhydroxylysine glucosidase